MNRRGFLQSCLALAAVPAIGTDALGRIVPANGWVPIAEYANIPIAGDEIGIWIYIDQMRRPRDARAQERLAGATDAWAEKINAVMDAYNERFK